MVYRVLIVEDDLTIATLLDKHLQKWGFDVSCARNFADVLADFIKQQPHVVLLDIALPFYNGFYWCSEIRKISTVPIIFISSRAENMDIIMAINMGGDDYIIKPFAFDIVVAKLHAVLRRAYQLINDPLPLEAKGLTLCMNDSTVSYRDITLELTKNEYRIMQLLLENKNQIVPREHMMKKLWDSDSYIDENTLSVNVNRLRKKLDELGIYDLITTKKGQGYIIYD